MLLSSGGGLFHPIEAPRYGNPLCRCLFLVMVREASGAPSSVNKARTNCQNAALCAEHPGNSNLDQSDCENMFQLFLLFRVSSDWNDELKTSQRRRSLVAILASFWRC